MKPTSVCQQGRWPYDYRPFVIGIYESSGYEHIREKMIYGIIHYMKQTILIIVILFIGALTFYWLSTKDTSSEIIEDTRSETTISTELINNLTQENAELVAYGFIQDFIAVAPPEPDQPAIERIMKVLSKNASAQIRKETISSDLAGFIGVQDVPDQGASVEDLQSVSPTESYLVVGLNYSGGRVLRNVHVIAEDGQWKVDSVDTPQTQQAEGFDKTGNLVRNNPGMKTNVWYVVYESQGQPALSTELEFTQASICAEGAENNTCDPAMLTQGSRVRLLGEVTDQDAVRVIRLEMK